MTNFKILLGIISLRVTGALSVLWTICDMVRNLQYMKVCLFELLSFKENPSSIDFKLILDVDQANYSE